MKQLFSFNFVFSDKTSFSEDVNDYTNWPIFVSSLNGRGTVSSSLILVSNDGRVDFIEKSWTEKQEIKHEVRFSFLIN
jgi:uncharacterized protein with NRDE domain